MIWMLLILLLPLVALMIRPVWFTGAAKKQSQENLALYRERTEELKTADLEPEERQELQLELDREFLAQSEGLDDSGAVVRNSGNGVVLLVVVVLFTTVVTAVLYPFWGASQELKATALLDKGRQVELTGPEREALMDSLESVANKNPDNLEWSYLNARLLMADGQYDQAAQSFEQILAQLPDEATADKSATLTLLAEARFYGSDQKPSEPVYQLLVDALALEPSNRQTLGMAGIMAFELNKPAAAIEHWRLLWLGLPDGPESKMLEQGIRRAASIAEEKGTEIDLSWLERVALQVRVSLSEDALANVNPGDTVFVLARASQGPPMPLAVQRLTVADLPADVSLSDAQAMAPGMSISQFDSLTLIARVSQSGQPVAAPGDWQAAREQVSNRETSVIELIINEQVD